MRMLLEILYLNWCVMWIYKYIYVRIHIYTYICVCVKIHINNLKYSEYKISNQNEYSKRTYTQKPKAAMLLLILHLLLGTYSEKGDGGGNQE